MGRPFRSPKRQARQSCTPSKLLTFVLVVLFLLPVVPAFAARLGGAYYVDDAEIGKPGSCEIETWSSFARTGDRIAVLSPACVINPSNPIELGTNLVDIRQDGQEDVLATLTLSISEHSITAGAIRMGSTAPPASVRLGPSCRSGVSSPRCLR